VNPTGEAELTIEHRRKTDKRLQRADAAPVAGRHRHGPHHGDWHTYTIWAAEAGHPHGADPYATHAMDGAWSAMGLDRVELVGVLQPATAA